MKSIPLFLPAILQATRPLTKIIITGIILLLSVPVFATEKETTSQAREAFGGLTLWYAQPATEWTQTLPIGNGRLGSMVYGGIEQEHLQLNFSAF